MSYPTPDGTANAEISLFQAGVTSFNEDYESIEQNRERDTLYAFSSIVKTPGIVAKHTEENSRLFPSTVSGNQIKITAGTGYTQNGSRITIPVDLTVNNITGVTGYSVPSGSNNVYVVLRKVASDYSNRPHPITGIQYPTRRRFLTDNSIVECISISGEGAITDKDVIVVGRLTGVSPATWDTTETTGYRKILRITEALTCETTGFTMEGDIDFDDRYNSLNYPQWGQLYWTKLGAPGNKDFQRLFARVNQHTAVLRGVRFQAVTGGYGIKFANDSSVKIKILPAQRPPTSIDIIKTNEEVLIPDNYVAYLTLTDSQVLVTEGGGGGGTETAGVFEIASITSSNLGDGGGTLRRFPICWHFYDGASGSRMLIFMDGTVLNVGDEITQAGYHSAYLRRTGLSVESEKDTNYMSGDLDIRRTSGKLLLTQGSGSPSSDVLSGIAWMKAPPFNSVSVAEFTRYVEVDGGGSIPSGAVTRDMYITVADNDGENGKSFIFGFDGKLKIVNNIAPSVNMDVLTLQHGLDKRGLSLTSVNNYMTGNLKIQKYNPELVMQDTSPPNGSRYLGVSFKNSTGNDIGGIYQLHADGGGYFDGDLLFRSDTVSPGSPQTFVLRTSGKLEMTHGYIHGALELEDGDLTPPFTPELGGRVIRSVNLGGDTTAFGKYQISTRANETEESTERHLINYSDGTYLSSINVFTIPTSESYTGLSAKVPSVFNNVLVVINYSIRTYVATGWETIRFNVKDSGGSSVYKFSQSHDGFSSSGGSVLSGSRQFILTSSVSGDVLKLYAYKDNADSGNDRFLGDTTKGTSFYAVVLN